MDQHPIPQDVTGFQFKLIGTMTVKQFGYVASGVIMAVVLYYMPLNTPLAFLIKLALIPMLGASGVIIAFVPIDGRPVDVMATNFVKALFSPNQYIYHRQGRKFSFSTVTVMKAPVVKKDDPKAVAKPASVTSPQSGNKEEQLRAFLMKSPGRVSNDLDKKEVAFLKNFPAPTAPSNIPAPVAAEPTPIKAPIAPIAVAPQPILPPLPKPTPIVQVQTPLPSVQTPPPAPQKETSESLASKEDQLAKELAKAKQEETISPAPAVAHQKVETLESQIQTIHSQKLQLENELTKLKTQLSEQKNPQPLPPPAVVAETAPQTAPVQSPPAVSAAPATAQTGLVQDPQHVRTLSQELSIKAGLPKVSDSPNVVIGIVKDPRQNVLPNILVEVKDKDGNPVRAFKTNPLGQFASATPLSPGTYTMELEDPKKLHRFDVIQIVANNQIMPPIEVISHDAREELRQQLFAS